MKNNQYFSLETLESRTLFAGAGEVIEFGEGSDLISTLESFFGADDLEQQNDTPTVACHTETLAEVDSSNPSEVSEPSDNEAKKVKKGTARYDTSDFDWYHQKKRDSKISEPRFSHKVMKEYKPKSLSGAAENYSIQLESLSDVGNLALNVGTAVVDGATNWLIGSPSAESNTPHYIRYISGLATLGLFWTTIQNQHLGRF